MLERFANVLYYFFLSVGFIVASLGTYKNISYYSNIGKIEYIYYGLLFILLGVFIFVFGWSIRYVLTGRTRV
jgi:hypothetical protein